MPELPEVETVCRSLRELVLNKKITFVDIFYERIIKSDLNEFKTLLVNQTFHRIERKGKYIIFVLDDYIIVSHLRMEGKYFLMKDEAINKHEHVIFHLENGETFRYNDTRKFGTMELFKTNDVFEVVKMAPLNKLGIEPISGELTVEFLKDKFRNKKEPIKTALLDQSIIVGIGNIYADEILFLSKINPYKKANELNDIQLKSIIDNTRIVLEKAIKEGGTTIKSYTSSEGVHGRFQQMLNVHQRKNEKCLICNSEIIKVVIGGRGTYYCPECQKKDIV